MFGKNIYVLSNSYTKRDLFVGIYDNDNVAIDACVEVLIRNNIIVTECDIECISCDDFTFKSSKLDRDFLVSRYDFVVSSRTKQSYAIQKIIDSMKEDDLSSK